MPNQAAAISPSTRFTERTAGTRLADTLLLLTPGTIWGASLLALDILGTGVAFAILATAAGRLGATRASATAFVIPGVALALGVLVRGETVAPLAVLGALLSLSGVSMQRRAHDP